MPNFPVYDVLESTVFLDVSEHHQLEVSLLLLLAVQSEVLAYFSPEPWDHFVWSATIQ